MKYLLNYAHLKYYQSQKIQTESAVSKGNFDTVFQCSFSDIGTDFYTRNKAILDQSRGAGYWLWKPYLILKHLRKLNEDDFLFYLDSGAQFIDRIDPLFQLCKDRTPGLLCFHLEEGPFLKVGHNYESQQTKRDVYIVMGCDNEDFWYNNYPVHGGMNGWMKNEFTIAFLEEWLMYAQKEEIITDSSNKYGKNLPCFVAHRHDQSILSVLRKKYNVPTFTDPSQYGNSHRIVQGNLVPHIINHHRSPR